MNSNRSAQHPQIPLEEAFKNAYISFSHFQIAQDSKVLGASLLPYSLIRGCAIQAKDNQVSIDAVIPIHMGTETNPITTETMSAINLQFKNWKASSRCLVDWLITVPDTNQLVISIVFEFGEEPKKNSHVRVSKASNADPQITLVPHPNDHHYALVAYGHGPKTFGVVCDESKPFYDIILCSQSPLEDFPQNDDEELVDCVQKMTPVEKSQASRYLSLVKKLT